MCKGLHKYFYRFLLHKILPRQSKVSLYSRQQKLNLESPEQSLMVIEPASPMVLCDLGKSGDFSGLRLLCGLTRENSSSLSHRAWGKKMCKLQCDFKMFVIALVIPGVQTDALNDKLKCNGQHRTLQTELCWETQLGGHG